MQAGNLIYLQGGNRNALGMSSIIIRRGENVHLSCSDDKRNKSKRAGWGPTKALVPCGAVVRICNRASIAAIGSSLR